MRQATSSCCIAFQQTKRESFPPEKSTPSFMVNDLVLGTITPAAAPKTGGGGVWPAGGAACTIPNPPPPGDQGYMLLSHHPGYIRRLYHGEG
jgi:hypothetical protein